MPGPCYCGHNCSRCVVYLATVRDSDTLRLQAQRFYRDTFGFDIPLSEVRCLGGRSDTVLKLCEGCPWRTCCRERGLEACSDCPEYPCAPLERYIEKYVNKCGQITAD